MVSIYSIDGIYVCGYSNDHSLIYSNGQLVDGLPSPVDIYQGIYAIYGMNMLVDELTYMEI